MWSQLETSWNPFGSLEFMEHEFHHSLSIVSMGCYPLELL